MRPISLAVVSRVITLHSLTKEILSTVVRNIPFDSHRYSNPDSLN